MMTQNKDKKRGQIQIFCMDDMVPQDHLLRIIDKAIDWNFIYGLVVDKYSPEKWGCRFINAYVNHEVVPPFHKIVSRNL